MDFQERQKQIYELSSFISEQEKWLEGVLGKLQWTKGYLTSTSTNLEQCPYNANHYVPSSSLERHKARCWYSSRGVKVDREAVQTLASTGAFYGDSSDIPHIHIDRATEEAVHKLAPQLQAQQSLPLYISLPSKQSESLESSKGTPPELLTLPPNQIISYIKSWQKVPSDFASLHPSTFNLPQIKGWLFQNLPDKHTHSSALGGEIVIVETIMSWLSPSTDGSATAPPNLTPDALASKLTPMLGLKSKAFVLELWKHVHISRLQREHNIEGSVVEDIVPLTAAALLNRLEHNEEKPPTISERIEELLVKTGSEEEETSLPLPMDHVFYKFSTSERRTLYDYAVEVAAKQGSLSKVKELDPDLYRDDAAALKAKLKAQKQSGFGEDPEDEEGSANYLEQLKRKRDYRRRRQTYRAKNVHITRKTPREIFRDIINNRMEEIAAAAATEAPSNEGRTNKQQTHDIHEGTVTTVAQITGGAVNIAAEESQEEGEEEGEWPKSPKPSDSETVKDSEEEGYSERSRSHKRKRQHHRSRLRSRSRSGSRSRSKERHHKKHKKHRSRSRSHSRSRHRRKHKRHSRSKSPSN